MKKRWIILTLFVATPVLLVWLEPTRVVWGWLRGEAFYQGRPTSWWAGELAMWKESKFLVRYGPDDGPFMARNWWRQPGFLEEKIPFLFRKEPDPYPPLLNGDPAAEAVLRELLLDSSPGVRRMASEGLALIGLNQESS
jgi:hypothetical protein